MKQFLNGHDARQYLNSSVIRLKGEPVIIMEVEDTGRERRVTEFLFHYRRLMDLDKMLVTDYPGEGWDLTPVPLGMVNLHGSVGYLSRAPARQYKIGLSRRNVQIRSVTGRGVPRLDNIFPSPKLGDVILGKYPSLDEALKKKYCAFSRRFAHVEGQLHYKVRGPVGTFKDGVPVLSDRWFFLKEALEEDMKHGSAAKSGVQAA